MYLLSYTYMTNVRHGMVRCIINDAIDRSLRDVVARRALMQNKAITRDDD